MTQPFRELDIVRRAQTPSCFMVGLKYLSPHPETISYERMASSSWLTG